jgi:diguanylate cyclase (GGDEF)-like protein/PAS domain S-box-containing protein
MATTAYAAPYQFAIYAYEPKAEIERHYAALSDYLAQALNNPVELQVLNAEEIQRAVLANRIDFMLVNPSLYEIIRNQNALISVIATVEREREGKKSEVLGGVIFTLNRPPNLERLQDMAGKTVAVPSFSNAGSFRLPLYEMHKAGMAKEDVNYLLAGNNHEVVQAVLRGDAEVGFVRTGVLEELFDQGRLQPEMVHILNAKHYPDFPYLLSTSLYPEWPFVVTAQVNEQTEKALSIALYSLRSDNPVARQAGIAGFVSPADYEGLRAILREMRLSPFDEIPELTWQELLHAYDFEVAGVLLMIALLITGLVVTYWFKRKAEIQKKKLDNLLFATQAMTWDWHIDSGRVLVNSVWSSFLGWDQEELGDFSYERWSQLVHPDDFDEVMKSIRLHLSGKSPLFEAEMRLQHINGDWLWVMARGRVTEWGANNAPLLVSGTNTDIHVIKENQRLLDLRVRRDEVLLRLPSLAETLDEASFMQKSQEMAEDLTGSKISFIHLLHESSGEIELVAWSKRTLEHYCHVTDYERHYPLQSAGVWADSARSKKPVVINDYATYVDKKGLPQGHAPLQRMISVPVIEQNEVVMLTGVGNKETPYSELDVETIQLLSNEIWRLVKAQRIQQQIAVQQLELEQMAHYDGLTHLPNRGLFYDRVEQTLLQQKRTPQALALAFIDLDGFKEVNDRFGHQAGDHLLKVIANRFLESVRDGDTVARLGGDEFTVLLHEAGSAQDVIGIVNRFLEAVKQPVLFNEQTLQVSASIGVCLYYGGGDYSAEKLLQTADQAMYQAKEAGKSRIQLEVLEAGCGS